MAHQLRILGSPEVLDGNGNPVPLSQGKPLALLIYVACSSTAVSRDDLADLLWPEAGRQKGRHSVRQALWVLRTALGEDIFSTHDPLTLKPGILEVDLIHFNQALAKGQVDEARSLWRSPVLDHFFLTGSRQWKRWTEDLRTDLEGRFSRALLQHAQTLREEGELEGAISVLDQAVSVLPSSEAPHLARIELLLDLLRMDAVREALADAHRSLGDRPESGAYLKALEARFDQIIKDHRSRVTEGESFPMEFVGRSREMAEVHALWRDANLGRTRIGVITGPSGIGKTRLAQELLASISGTEFRSVAIKGTRAEMKLQWGAASDFVRSLLLLPGSAGISSASDSLLRAMLPSMGRGEAPPPTVNGFSPASILDAVTDLLQSITFETPLLILVDDFQWMDRDSRTLFIGLANRCREVRALFLILGRSDLSSRHWEEVEGSLVSEAGARRFELHPLIEEEVGEILALAAAFPDPEEALNVVSKIHQASSGNPLFIREILKDLQEKGFLEQEGPGWIFRTAELPREFELSENIRSLLKERLDRLSEPACNLAATLASLNRGASLETLQKGTRLPSAVFSKAIAELLERGVIEWADGTTLDFVHDILRDTASTHLSGSLPEPPPRNRWLTRNQAILAMVVGILVALPLGVLWGRGLLPLEEEDTPLPYGGGTIVLRKGEGPIRALRILEEPLEVWEPVDLDLLAPPGTRSLFRAPGGGFIWFGADDSDEGPDLVTILPDGTRVPFFPEPGDESIQDVSPEGGRALFTSENVGSDRFSHSLYWADLWERRARHLILEGSGPLGAGTFSPDGDRVAFSIVDRTDSLAVYTLAGERLWAKAFGEILGISWCKESIVFIASPGGQPHLFQIDPQGEEVIPIAPLPLGRGLTCSPDGSAVMLTDLADGRPVFILRNLLTGDVHPFNGLEVEDAVPAWIPDAVATVPVRLRAEADTIRMEWGDRRTPLATVYLSDGSRSLEGVWWESLDPSVANFNPSQELTGNQAGIARVLARWGHSLMDTVVVIVEDNGSGGPTALITERWDSLDSSRWIAFGSHPPVVRPLEGENVLELLGDEKYSDGVMLKTPVPLDQGVTIEYEFKMEINRDVHQNISLCLRDTDPERYAFEAAPPGGPGEVLCFLYPAREFEKMDPSEGSVMATPGVETRTRVPETLPSGGWTHVALQIRPDGEVSLVLNRERVATSPVRISTIPHHQWTVGIDADAIGTEVFVRNVNIWREVRY